MPTVAPSRPAFGRTNHFYDTGLCTLIQATPKRGRAPCRSYCVQRPRPERLPHAPNAFSVDVAGSAARRSLVCKIALPVVVDGRIRSRFEIEREP